VAWYSIIHVPPERLSEVFAEFHRVLAPGGHLLLAFQADDEPLRFTEAFGHAVSLDFHRLRPGVVAELLNRNGLVVRARPLREPGEYEGGVEKTQQAYLLARKPPT
jgi:SAM-dependent methyltransferase